MNVRNRMIRVAGASPRQIAAMGAIPCQEPLTETPPLGGRGKRRRHL